MPKNAELLSAIGNLKSKSKAEREQALDAILKADHTDPLAFRKAVVDNTGLWSTLPGNIMVVPTKGTWTTFFSRGYIGTETPVTGYLESDQFLDPNGFQKIKQAAAEERVKFGLVGVDNEVLVNILKNNGEQCRRYLADKLRPQGIKFDEIHGWDPTNENVLTASALKNIKTEAANLLLLQLIAKPELRDLKLFKDLIDAQTAGNVGDIQKAAKALAAAAGVDPTARDDFANALTKNLTPEIIREAKARRDALQSTAYLEEFKQKLQAYESGLTRDVLLRETIFLNQGDVPFRNDFFTNKLPAGPYRDPAKALPEAQRLTEEMHKRLCARYVEEKLKTIPAPNPVNLVNVLKETVHGPIKTAIQHFIPGEDEILNRAVIDNPETNRLFKAALVKSFTKQLTDKRQIADILNAKNLDEVRQQLSLSIPGVTKEQLECIKDSDLAEIKQAARRQYFKILIQEQSPFGKDYAQAAHAKLIEAFSALPASKQLDLLRKKDNLPFIFKAQTDEKLKSYLGNVDVAAIKDENKRNTLLKEIHNSGIAKVLAGYKPAITIGPAQIKNINDFLLQQRADDLTNANLYKAVIDKVYLECGNPGTLIDFYSDFNLNSTGLNFKGSTAISDAVANQHAHNVKLFDELERIKNDASQTDYQKLIRILLRVEKTAQFNPVFATLKTHLNESQTLEKFLGSSEVAPIKDGLSKELSNDDYQEIRTDRKEKVAKSAQARDTAEIKNDVEGAQQVFDGIHKKVPTLQKRSENLSAKLQEVTKPELHGKSTTEIQALQKDYQKLKLECLEAIDYLERCQKELSRPPAIPPKLVGGTNNEITARNKIREQATELQSEYKKELARVQTALGHYQAIYKKVSENILPEFNKKAKDSEREIYTPTDIKIYVHKRDKVQDMKTTIDSSGAQVISRGVGPTHTSALMKGVDDGKLFDSVGKPAPDEVIYFDTETTVRAKVPKSDGTAGFDDKNVKLEGRFTYDPSPKSVTSGTLQGSSLHRSIPGKFEVIQPPRDETGKAKSQEVTDEVVEFYMKMAVEIVTNMEKPPSKDNPIKLRGVRGKEDEIKHLWTALAYLGEKNSKMKFSPDALVVIGTANFDPQKEREKRAIVGTDKGFSANSTYKAIFESRAVITDRHVGDLAKRLKEKEAEAKKTQKVDSTVHDAMQVKDDLDVIKAVQVENKKKVAEEGISQTVAQLTSK